ncbi:MAG: hypothetical protein ACXABY_37205, partial [Candidatus Thorarchaeota archaeon]
YNGHCVDEKEQNLIMEYMKEVGIEWLDVAWIYGTMHTGKEFKRFVKGVEGKRGFYASSNDVFISHTNNLADGFYDGVSVYRNETIPLSSKYVEIPYSILDNIVPYYPTEPQPKLIARSIFCKGKALKYFSPRDCLDFVLMNPRIDKVIMGVDSVDQLHQNIIHLVKMEQFTHNEEVDTRKF